MLRIDLDELEAALQIALRTLRAEQGEHLEFEKIDFYWAAGPDELYDPYQKPARLGLGQISDDLEEMRRLVTDDTDPTSLYLVKVCAILEALGHEQARKVVATAGPASPKDAAMQFTVADLETALQKLFARLRESQGDSVTLPAPDLYWSVGPQEIYNPYETPTDFHLGRLSDAWEELQALARGESPPVADDLVDLSAVLAAVGYKTVW